MMRRPVEVVSQKEKEQLISLAVLTYPITYLTCDWLFFFLVKRQHNFFSRRIL